MKEKILIRELIKDKNVGAVAASSSDMVNSIIQKITFQGAKIFVEYGPGNGTITKQLLSHMDQDAILFVFETNSDFIQKLQLITDNRLFIINNDAEVAKLILKNRYKITKVDYIISTIPFSFIKKPKRRRIIYKSYQLLKENGKFITYQYSWLIYNIIKSNFTRHKIKPILFNVPPAFIMEGVK